MLQAFINYTNNTLAEMDFAPQYLIDFEFDKNEPTILAHAILDIGALKKHWGQGVEEPLILIKNIIITPDNIKLMGKNQDTIRIDIPGNDGISLIKFRITDDDKNYLLIEEGCITINVIGTCDINTWNGAYPQVHIKDYEIINRSMFYF